MGEEVKKKPNFLFLLSCIVQEMEESKGACFANDVNCSFFKMSDTSCLLREQSEPSFFVSQVSKAMYVSMYLCPEASIASNSHFRQCKAKKSQPCIWLMWSLASDCGPDGDGISIF